MKMVAGPRPTVDVVFLPPTREGRGRSRKPAGASVCSAVDPPRVSSAHPEEVLGTRKFPILKMTFFCQDQSHSAGQGNGTPV